MFRAIPVLLTAVVLAGCVSASPEGERVRLAADSRAVEGCAFIEQISTSSSWGGAFQGVADDNTIAELRNRTIEAGGDTLLIVTSAAGWGGARKTADIYRCRT